MIVFSYRGISHYHLTDFNLLFLSFLSTGPIDLSACVLFNTEFLQSSRSGGSGLLSEQQIFGGLPGEKVSRHNRRSLLTLVMVSAWGYLLLTSKYTFIFIPRSWRWPCNRTCKPHRNKRLCRRLFLRGYSPALAASSTFSVMSFRSFPFISSELWEERKKMYLMLLISGWQYHIFSSSHSYSLLHFKVIKQKDDLIDRFAQLPSVPPSPLIELKYLSAFRETFPMMTGWWMF